MAESIPALKSRVNTIATEQDKGDNTKERVAALLDAIIDFMSELQTGGSPVDDGIDGGFEATNPEGSIDGGFETE